MLHKLGKQCCFKLRRYTYFFTSNNNIKDIYSKHEIDLTFKKFQHI